MCAADFNFGAVFAKASMYDEWEHSKEMLHRSGLVHADEG